MNQIPKYMPDRRFTLYIVAVFAVSISLLNVANVSAQIQASEKASLTRVIDGTNIEITYSRPSRRGRSPIFGGFVHWGEVWTPGADWATTLTIDKDIEIDGTPIPEGAYSMWIALRENNNWELALSTEARKFHIPYLDLESAFVRIPITPAKHASEMETLVFYFPEITATGGILRMHWGDTSIDMNIMVQSSQRTTATPEEAAIIAGLYEVQVLPGNGFGVPPTTADLELGLHDGILWGPIEIGWPEPLAFGLAPISEAAFHPMLVIEGQPASVFKESFVEFDLDGSGHAMGFQFRNENDDVWMKGTRKN